MAQYVVLRILYSYRVMGYEFRISLILKTFKYGPLIILMYLFFSNTW